MKRMNFFVNQRFGTSVSVSRTEQGRIKRGATGAIAPGPPLQKAPGDEIYWFQIKYSFENFRDSEAIQEYNSILYSYVALSIRAHNSNWFLYSYVAWSIRAHNSNWFLCKFDCLPVLLIAIEEPIGIFGFVQCKYILFRCWIFLNNIFLAWI